MKRWGEEGEKSEDIVDLIRNWRIEEIVDKEGRNRKIRRGKMIRNEKNVGIDVESMEEEEIESEEEEEDELIRKKKDIVEEEKWMKILKICIRRKEKEEWENKRIEDERGNGVGELRKDEMLKIVWKESWEMIIDIKRKRIVVMMREEGMKNKIDGKIEGEVIVGKESKDGGGNGKEMIEEIERNDIIEIRIEKRIGEIKDEIEEGIIRLREGIGEIGIDNRKRRNGEKILRKIDKREMREIGKGMIKWKFINMKRRRLRKKMLRKKKEENKKERNGLNIEFEGNILEIDEVEEINKERELRLKKERIGVGMKVIKDIEGLKRVRMWSN